MKAIEDIFDTYIMGTIPMVMVDSIEVDRATECLMQFVDNFNRNILPGLRLDDDSVKIKMNGLGFHIWDGHTGLYSEKETNGLFLRSPIDGTINIQDALTHLITSAVPGVYVIQNYHLYFQDALDNQKLIPLVKELIRIFEGTYKYLILLGDMGQLPPELERDVSLLEIPIPTREELITHITEYIASLGMKFKNSEIAMAAESAVGLTLREVESAVKISIVECNGDKLDKEVILSEKRKAIEKSGYMELIPTMETVDSIGGLEPLKEWGYQMAELFRRPDEARKFGLQYPKGVILTGVQGTGKSLYANALASLFGVDAYDVDLSNVFGGLVGETEKNTKALLRFMNSAAPCVIRLDEIEKLLAGIGSSDRTDGGVTARFLGKLLSYTEERKVPVFLVGTANNVNTLPPEMLRKGRWNEIFFVDIPSETEKQDILTIHLKKTGRDPKKFNVKRLVNAAPNLTGAEIEEAIQSGLRKAFFTKKELTEELVEDALRNTRGIVHTNPVAIESLRSWATGNARPANRQESPGLWSGPAVKRAKKVMKSS